MGNKTLHVELLAALKTIQENGLESEYIADKISLLEDLVKEHTKEAKPKKPLFENYRRDVVIYTDGASKGNPGPSGCGCIIEIGDYLIKKNHFIGDATNNEAEYLGVILALKTLKELGVKGVPAYFFSDSMLVMKQLDGSFKIKNPRMQSYADEVHELLRELNLFAAFSHYPREENKEADILSNAAINGTEIDEMVQI